MVDDVDGEDTGISCVRGGSGGVWGQHSRMQFAMVQLSSPQPGTISNGDGSEGGESLPGFAHLARTADHLTAGIDSSGTSNSHRTSSGLDNDNAKNPLHGTDEERGDGY